MLFFIYLHFPFNQFPFYIEAFKSHLELIKVFKQLHLNILIFFQLHTLIAFD